MRLLVTQERKKKIRVKLLASLSPVGLVCVRAWLGLRLRLRLTKKQVNIPLPKIEVV